MTELLALVFDRGVRGASVIELSQRLLGHFKTLNRIQEASFEELRKIKGIGFAKACQVKACIEIARRLKNLDEAAEKSRAKIRAEKSLSLPKTFTSR
ncbi:MAG: hypothetical protein NZL96_03575 [Patescibacteria group bacterium]|nr:hypothetical protein [Patescibacteria group bacterium]